MTSSFRHPRGTVITYFLVILSVLTTGLVTTLAVTSGGQAQIAGLTLKRDQGYYAAEAGIERAYWILEMVNNSYQTNGTPLTGTVGNASYSTTVTGAWNSPMTISSVGTINGVVGDSSSVTITAIATPRVFVPAISLGGNFNNSGNVTITGDVYSQKSISTSGKLSVTGSLDAKQTVTMNGSVTITGTVTQNDPNVPSLPTVSFPALLAAAQANGQVITVPAGTTLDVSSLNLGNNGTIYYTGGGNINFKGKDNVTGTGTLVCDGNITINSAASFDSTSNHSSVPANCNIVTQGILDVKGYLGLAGSIYSTGTISKNGGLNVTGVIVGTSDLNTNGGMTLFIAQPPAFFQYPSSTGVGSMVLSNETGPIF